MVFGRMKLGECCARVGFGLIDLIRGTSTLPLLRDLEKIQFESPEEIEQRQKALLNNYVARVKNDCALYSPYPTFARFPVIDKVFANTHRTQLLNPHYKGKLVRKKTGGSTGVPFVYWTGVQSQSFLWASILLSWRVAGYQLGDPVAFLAGTALFDSGFKQGIYYRLMNVRLFSAFAMSPEKLDSYCAAIAKQGCTVLYGYAYAIHQLAVHLLTLPVRPAFKLRGVVCTSEPLTESMRKTIDQAFGVPCYSQYGCHDAGVSAYECERRAGFHLVTLRSYQEVLEGGTLVSTDMANEAFFLPRYDTGDMVTMQNLPCGCGRGFPLINTVVGRVNDVVLDMAGNCVHSMFFSYLFRENRQISEFQVIFDDSQLLVILHCADGSVEHSGYEKHIRKALAFDSVRFVFNIPFVETKNGKRRFVLRVDDVASASS